MISKEIKKKYPIGADFEMIDNVRFIKSIEKKKDTRQVCNPDTAMAMLANGCDMINKRPWMVLDKEVQEVLKKIIKRIFTLHSCLMQTNCWFYN